MPIRSAGVREGTLVGAGRRASCARVTRPSDDGGTRRACSPKPTAVGRLRRVAIHTRTPAPAPNARLVSGARDPPSTSPAAVPAMIRVLRPRTVDPSSGPPLGDGCGSTRIRTDGNHLIVAVESARVTLGTFGTDVLRVASRRVDCGVEKLNRGRRAGPIALPAPFVPGRVCVLIVEAPPRSPGTGVRSRSRQAAAPRVIPGFRQLSRFRREREFRCRRRWDQSHGWVSADERPR